MMEKEDGTGKKSHLLQMRGLKRGSSCRTFLVFVSHLLQMRGLKQYKNKVLWTVYGSHLLQMRGLKHNLDNI